MNTVTLMNGLLYLGGNIIAVILCIPATLFRLTTLFPFSCQETFVLKCCLLLSTAAYMHPHYRLLLIIPKKTLVLKERLKSQTLHTKIP